MIKVLSEGIVASRPGQMYAWPGITRAANGDILVAASERKFHRCPGGREVIMRSSDHGHTWSLPEEVYNSELDDRDANLLTLQDGSLLLSWFTSNAFEEVPYWQERSARVSDQLRKELIGAWLLRSDDNGVTWSDKPFRMPVGNHISPIELSDGSLISIGTASFIHPLQPCALEVHKSYDRGLTWKKTGEIDCPRLPSGRPELNENHILDTGNGRLIALFRKCGDCLRQAFSDDYGLTWSKPEKTEIRGLPPHLLKLSNGDILCSYSYRKSPFSIRGVLSHDNGKTWDMNNMFTIHEWSDQPDMGYPVSIEVAPGEILTVYYCSRRDGKTWPHMDQKINSSPEGILFTRFEIKQGG